MALPDNTLPANVADKVLQAQVDKMTAAGELNFTNWAGAARPATGWNLEAFQGLMQNGTASTPPFVGAQTAMPWMKQAKDVIGGAEGNEAYAYHGLLSSKRKDGVQVKEGHGSTEEVSVGYGFNLGQPGGRQLYESAIGSNGPSFEDVFNGRKPITAENAEQLRDYMILQKNALVDKATGHSPLRDHQRAALVSLAYNGNSGGLKVIGDAIKAKRPDAEIADLIRKTGTLGGKLQNRRNHEAALYMGAQAEGYFSGINANQLPTQVAGINPQDRH